MAPETRNLIAAMSLSLAILIGWQLYVVEPDLQADRAAYEAQQQAENNQTATTGQIAKTDVGAGQTSTDTVVQDSGVRIKIEAPQLSGSFSTMGGRLDDVVLKGYYETQDDDASQIHYSSGSIQTLHILQNLAGLLALVSPFFCLMSPPCGRPVAKFCHLIHQSH